VFASKSSCPQHHTQQLNVSTKIAHLISFAPSTVDSSNMRNLEKWRIWCTLPFLKLDLTVHTHTYTHTHTLE
jgi:hypothetical protein